MKTYKIILLILCALIPFSLFGCANQNKNTLSAPTNLEIDNGVIIFDAVKDAELYIVNISDMEFVVDSNYNSNVSIINNKINYNATKLLAVGESYSIKVKATASEMNDSPYSNTISYKHTLTLSKPENVKINGTNLTWDLVNNADLYLIKILTPYNKIIYDLEGNQLTGDDPETISKAELTEYSFTTNTFDFNSLLTEAGNYSFYINAIHSNGSEYSESGYTTKIVYKHSLKLATPFNGRITEKNGELHLNSVVDSMSNAIVITCNSNTKVVPLNNSEQSITVSNNMLDINISKLFPNINFNETKPYKIELQSKHITSTGSEQFYQDSNVSSSLIYEKTEKLSAPIISIQLNDKHMQYEASWTMISPANISGYKLFVYNGSNVSCYEFDNTITSMLLPADYQTVFVQAIGKGSYINSNFSNFASASTITNYANIGTVNMSRNNLSWSTQSNAIYIVQHNNKHDIITSNSYSVDLTNINSKNVDVILTMLKPNLKAASKTLTISNSTQLSTPVVDANQGFTSLNPYLLTFTPVENAIGYYVYIKSNTVGIYQRINTVYTSNAINLYQYIVTQNEFTTYTVRIEAVADPNSIYSNSNLSEELSVTHSNVLTTPIFSSNAVTKSIQNNRNVYSVNFYGVENAHSYELLINYNRLSIASKDANYVGLYNIDITQYLTAANKYEIKLRAIPLGSSETLLPSAYTHTSYTLTEQLQTVKNIKYAENDGKYTLSFDPVENASSYRVRIVKLSDSNYPVHLASLGLGNPFTVNQSTDITKYLAQQGEYHIYVTALAPKNSYYSDSNESSTYAVVSKLTSLKTPQNITFENQSFNNYIVSWDGDSNADYYLVKLTDPNNFMYEFNVYGATSASISNFLTVQGDYDVNIYSMIDPTSVNSKTHLSSSASEKATTNYTYENKFDFERYSVSLYGNETNFVVDNLSDLKTLLWYHYLYELDDYGLKIYLTPQAIEATGEATLRGAILQIAEQLNTSTLYSFNSDSSWLSLVNEETTTDSDLLRYLCTKILELYPELNALDNEMSVTYTEGTNNFKLYYKNALNREKVNEDYSDIINILNQSTATLTTLDYSNKFEYLNSYIRRSTSSVFGIDNRPEKLVSTTEQLVQAVEYGYKPKFYGDSESAEKVYLNAKKVLVSIITNNMSDTEKATRIFDWISYAYNLNKYADQYADANLIKQADITEYGLRQDFYLEGTLLNISDFTFGGYDGEFYLNNRSATKQSYAKTFSLLCAIEGIKTISVFGTMNTAPHIWNKIELTNTWYNVDIASSDNTNNEISMASHTYFLVSDNVVEKLLKLDESSIISSELTASVESNSTYNYYGNSKFALTDKQVSDLINKESQGFAWAKQYKDKQGYNDYSSGNYTDMSAMIINLTMHARVYQQNNKCHFEFSFNWEENAGDGTASTIINSEHIGGLAATYTDANFNFQLKIYGTYGNIYIVKDETNSRTIVMVAFDVVK